MKLLYITNGICGSGGLERVLSIKASHFAEKLGYDVHVLSLNESSSASTFFEFSSKIKRHTFYASGNPIMYIQKYKKNIKKKCREINPDIILVCDDGLKGFFVPRILKTKTPIIYERHVSKLIEISEDKSFLKKRQTFLKFYLMNKLGAKFTKFILLTEGNRKEWNLNNIQVIPNPLPFYPDEKAKLETSRVIAVGKQSYQKAYDILLKIWKLTTENVSGELHIFGKKQIGENLEILAEKLDVEGSVFFHEPAKDIIEKYKGSSIFVLSSRYEGFGMVIIEAMACGLPVVSFDCPYGPSDIITDGEDGFLIPNGEINLFAEKLELLMKEEEIRKKMGEAARENVKKFLPENIINQWDLLFKSLLT